MQNNIAFVIDSSEVRKERSRGNRFVLINGQDKSYFIQCPSQNYMEGPMPSGEQLYELLPSNKLKLIYSKP